MKTRTLVLLLVSAGCGLVAATLVGQLVGPREEAKVEVLVASRQVPRGTLVKNPEEFFQVRAVSRDGVPATALTSLEGISNQVMQRTLDAGQVCTSRDLAADAGLTGELPTGSLALAARVTLDSSVAGFVKPGDHVDLICTVADPKQPKERLTKIFMQDVPVLAVNQFKESMDRSSPIGNPVVVTLAVKPEQAERLAWVKEIGPVTLALRKTGDLAKPETPGARNAFGPPSGPALTIAVPVARKRIQPGTVLRADNINDYFELRPQLASTLPPGTIAHLEQLENQTIRRFLAAGQCCTDDYLNASPDRRQSLWQDIHNGSQWTRTEYQSLSSPLPAGKDGK